MVRHHSRTLHAIAISGTSLVLLVGCRTWPVDAFVTKAKISQTEAGVPVEVVSDDKLLILNSVNHVEGNTKEAGLVTLSIEDFTSSSDCLDAGEEQFRVPVELVSSDGEPVYASFGAPE